MTADQILKTLRKNRSLLTKYKVKKIGLFGSFARKRQKTGSDIDFVVSFEEPTFENFMGLLFALEGLFGRKVDLITEGNMSPYMQPFIEKEIMWYGAR